MASKELKAREAGIELRSGRDDFRTTCPQCSPTRRKKRDPCLHVTVTSHDIRWCCFHCDFKGVASDDTDRRATGHGGPTERGRAAGRPVQKRWW